MIAVWQLWKNASQGKAKMVFHQPPCRWSGFTTWLCFDALFFFFTVPEICIIGRKYCKRSLVGSTSLPECKIIVPKCLLACMTWLSVVSCFSRNTCICKRGLRTPVPYRERCPGPDSSLNYFTKWCVCGCSGWRNSSSVFPGGCKVWDGKKKNNILEVSQIFQILTWEMFLAMMFIKESLKPQEEQNSSEMSSWACKWPGKACETGTALIF